jgi:hypothetical protein
VSTDRRWPPLTLWELIISELKDPANVWLVLRGLLVMSAFFWLRQQCKQDVRDLSRQIKVIRKRVERLEQPAQLIPAPTITPGKTTEIPPLPPGNPATPPPPPVVLPPGNPATPPPVQPLKPGTLAPPPPMPVTPPNGGSQDEFSN